MIKSAQQKDVDSDLLLQAIGISKSFGGNAVLKGLSLRLFQGDIVLLRGENASGKTTLLNLLTGNLEPDSGLLRIKGESGWEEFQFPQPWWNYLNPFNHFTPERVAREGVGRTWQDIRLFPKLSLLDNIALASPDQLGENPVWSLLRPMTVRRHERKNIEKAKALLGELRLDERGHQLSDTLSLGQSKRAAIARAIQAGAKILFLDEPLAGLDEQGINSVLDMLISLARKDRITLVIVEHLFHIPRLLRVADTVWTLKGGELFEETPDGSESSLVISPLDTNQQWIDDGASSDYEVFEHDLPGQATLSILRPSGDNACILSVEDLVVRRQGRTVIGSDTDGEPRGLSFKLCEGDTAILQAPNGWGKTTLLDAIMGLIPISQGQIVFRGQLMNALPIWRRAQAGMAYLQARGHTFSRLTVSETFSLAGAGPVPDYLSALAGRSTDQLSGGQQQLVGLSRVLRSPHITCRLLDEPFNMLDRAAIARTRHLLRPPEGSCSLVVVPSGPLGSGMPLKNTRQVQVWVQQKLEDGFPSTNSDAIG
jgi:ABC-type branched-chain amino acid transport systems, ATPase component